MSNGISNALRQKRRRRTPHGSSQRDAEAELAREVFGDLYTNASNDDIHKQRIDLQKDANTAAKPTAEQPEQSESDAEGSDTDPMHRDEDIDSDLVEEPEPESRKPAWQDEADAELEVDLTGLDRLKKLRRSEEETVVSGKVYTDRLREQHKKIYGSVSWADRALETKLKKKDKGAMKEKSATVDSDLESSDDESDSDDSDHDPASFEQSTGRIISRVSSRLDDGKLEIKRVRNANQQDPAKAVIQSLEFHPTVPLLMTGTYEKKISLFQVDGVRNSKVQSFFFPKMPVHQARFSASGERIYATGRRKFYYEVDMESGKMTEIGNIVGCQLKSLEDFDVSPDGKCVAFVGPHGRVSLVSTSSKHLLGDLVHSANVCSLHFGLPGTSLNGKVLTGCADGRVYIWDLRTRKCEHRFFDEGSTRVTALGTSSNNQFLSTGSSSGIVNTYSLADCLSGSNGDRPNPLHSYENLTTSIRDVQYNHDSQMMMFSSRKKKDALRMAHIPKHSVFSNWPTANTNLNYVNCTAFSPGSGYFAFGNDKGVVQMFQLKHYRKY